MLREERGKAGQVAVGLRFPIYLINNIGWRNAFTIQEQRADVFGQLPFQTIAHQSLAQMCSAAFIAQAMRIYCEEHK